MISVNLVDILNLRLVSIGSDAYILVPTTVKDVNNGDYIEFGRDLFSVDSPIIITRKVVDIKNGQLKVISGNNTIHYIDINTGIFHGENIPGPSHIQYIYKLIRV